MEKSRENEILKILSVALRRIFSSEIYDYNKLQEIRLRMNEPLIVIYDNREYFVTEKGKDISMGRKTVRNGHPSLPRDHSIWNVSRINVPDVISAW